jgi:hypothetical protein
MVRYAIALLLMSLSCATSAQEPSPAELNQAELNQAELNQAELKAAEPPAAGATSVAQSAESAATEPKAEASTAGATTESAESAQPNPTSSQSNQAEEDREAYEAKRKDLLSLVRDNTLNVHWRENPAYFMLVKEMLDRTPEQLKSEEALKPRFNQLHKSPAEYRGKLVTLKLIARRVLPIDAKPNSAGVTRLYEIWGPTAETKSWMYCCVVPELPPGVREGDIDEVVELTGYFFKLQAYQPGDAAPNAQNLVAPLIIGRIVRAETTTATAEVGMGNWPLILIIGFGTIVMFRMMMHMLGMHRKTPMVRNYRRRSLAPIDPAAVEDSLEVGEGGLRIRNANE